ncbi:putative symporter YidK [Caprobacter fermentans]|uniref:Putative symporter YidK n=1 Tax=Caproicibacter fermentans TaxID=2576756 RepID=A0A6N8HY16_9FIRM|nr:solute:sodium symporter family transporter [Caproicibacter fermentans]MVB10716.1 putative symporter YidK [Caproicibacter fermentans]OCN00479.1 solute:sodium symporter family transporter [Clostridium sp. W14A]
MTAWALGSFVFFTALVAVISWWMTRNDNLSTNTGYFLAGRSLTGVVIAGSLILTNLSAEQLVGTNGLGFQSGLSSMSWEATSGVTLVFMALIFLPRYLKGGFTTVPDFLEERFDEGTRNLVTALFLMSLALVTLPIVLYAGGIALNSLFNVGELLHMDSASSLCFVIALIGIVGGIYAIFGGLKAVAVSDTINGIGLLIGGLLIPILGLLALGNGNLIAGFSSLIVNSPERMDSLGSAKLPGTAPLGTLFTGMILVNTFYWCTNQQIVQRTFAAKDLVEGQKGVLLAGFIKIFTPIILVIPGVIAYQLYGSEIKNIDSAYSVLVNHVLPVPLIGFFGAVMFGAVLSSFNSALNSAATMFCINVYKPIFNKNVSDKKLVFIGKVFGIILAIFSILVAPQIAKAPNGLYTFMKSVMGFFNIPTLVVVLMGFATKKVPPIGAKISIAFFIAAYALYKFVFPIPIHFLYVYAILFLCCIAIMLIAGKIAPMKKEYHQKDVGQVDLTSWKYAKPISFMVLTTTLYVYFLFSRFGIVFHGENYGGRFTVITLIYLVLSAAGFVYIRKRHNKVFLEERSQKNEEAEEGVRIQ